MHYPSYSRNLDEDESVCTDLEEISDYLINLWVLGHATWVQAFRIKNNNSIETFAESKKQDAETMIQTFIYMKENVKPLYCNCIEEGIFYINFNHWLNPNNSMSVQARSPSECQIECNNMQGCQFWTYIQHLTKCLMFDKKAIQASINEEHDKKDIVSGPKQCQKYFSFCCGLGFGVSVTITFFIVLVSLIFLCCCCYKICD